jgi:CRP/FNR family cyclic AMP-dependent transcriptional regulator
MRPALTASELEEIAQHGVTRQYAARTVIVSEGERTDAIYIVLEGKVRAYVSDGEGREAVLSVIGPGEYFGEMAALDEGPRSASVITVEPTRVAVVPSAELAEFVARSPAFAMHLIRGLIGRVRALTENVRSLSLMDAYGRIARLLLEEARVEAGVQFMPRMTQAEIASRVGCTREMVSRILKELARGQYISVLPDRIVINRKPPAKW